MHLSVQVSEGRLQVTHVVPLSPLSLHHTRGHGPRAERLHQGRWDVSAPAHCPPRGQMTRKAVALGRPQGRPQRSRVPPSSCRDEPAALTSMRTRGRPLPGWPQMKRSQDSGADALTGGAPGPACDPLSAEAVP